MHGELALESVDVGLVGGERYDIIHENSNPNRSIVVVFAVEARICIGALEAKFVFERMMERFVPIVARLSQAIKRLVELEDELAAEACGDLVLGWSSLFAMRCDDFGNFSCFCLVGMLLEDGINVEDHAVRDVHQRCLVVVCIEVCR